MEYYSLCRPTSRVKSKKGSSPLALAEFAQQLMTAHPRQATQAYTPIVSLFEEVLGDAVDAGVVRPDLSRRRVAGIVLEAIMFNAFSATIGGTADEPDGGDPAEELSDLILHGIGRVRSA